MIDVFLFHWHQFSLSVLATTRDILPILVTIVGFQLLIIRKPLRNPRKLIFGFLYVLIGIAFFLEGLELALFPLGKLMAVQLTDPNFLGIAEGSQTVDWKDYFWVYIFAGCIGFSTTLAEPSLLAVAIKAQEISAGAIKSWQLRLTVSSGVACGIALGSYRIIMGAELYQFILVGYLIVIIQTIFAPKKVIGLAFDSGGVTTSTVTVPLVTALGIGLSSTVPGRNPLLDGFGLIAFAGLFSIIAVLAYAMFADWRTRRS